MKLSCVETAGDDGKVKIFRIPEGGLTDIVKTPEIVLQGGYCIVQYGGLSVKVFLY